MRRIVYGQSMMPFLRMLDECVCKSIDPLQISAGDIVTYRIPDCGATAIHRVLYVNKEEKHIVAKGDNILSVPGDIVPFSEVKEKVVTVKRGDRVFDLDTFPRRRANALIAFLSRHNLTPFLVKRRFLSPVLLSISRKKIYKDARKRYYKKLFFTSYRSGEGLRFFAFVGKTKSADALIKEKSGCGVIVSARIRHRDRNEEFARVFLDKIIEAADRQYGSEHDIHITDDTFEDLFLTPTEYNA